MFVLSEIKSLVRLLPKGFDKSLEEQLTDELNRKLSNRVLLNVGLCLSLFDILDIGESFIFPGKIFKCKLFLEKYLKNMIQVMDPHTPESGFAC